ncbi:DUF6719 family protein [Bradyrhizobium sp. BR 10289]|uniref:DUF6719 family protein n=1 Tax=Bradyrhizobium sp. BR 10289 TaxID=2749993 RepID=UPI001C650EBF|nr:DUF6719 family protein [Bradyrhizobium sp. BR 10289]MBW7968565.1 hypothetical protein [Bradyrhizobium sp. BR 10289]
MKILTSTSLTALVFVSQSALAQMVMKTEPPAGQLGPGQVVYVDCGPGKAMKITGGSNVDSNGVVGQGQRRQRGPCVAMKR